MKDLSKILKTKLTLSTVYHSQTDKKTKIINQEVKEFLQYYVNYQQDDWIEWLLAAEFQYNNKKRQSYQNWRLFLRNYREVGK